ncbi:peptidylprolyl isomerase [Mesorhizobium sp. CN5-321]|uniref:SurA N-terminal domain-containing protein n=1 Tax=Mesorhizobium hunchu TaxID=3157708 RepID=UPI0032B777A4
MRKRLFYVGMAALIATATVPGSVLVSPPAYASTIKYIVNDVPITTGDIQHRAAFLRLQHRKGDAANEMIEQTLKLAEAKRLGIRISDAQVNDAFDRFAKNNKMQPAQLTQIMARAGVTAEHFKEYIRTQMAWGQAVSARSRSESGLSSEQEAVRKMLDNGGEKPTATEYMLQQVIFVVPTAERKSILAKRKREAESMRARFNGCNTTREFAKGLLDVTVRDLGRVLAPSLPSDWADQIKKTKVGAATPVKETSRGVEFIGICSAREVSDDRVAELMLGGDGAEKNSDTEALEKKYVAELRQRARIVKR